jgi:hypothetical protein
LLLIGAYSKELQSVVRLSSLFESPKKCFQIEDWGLPLQFFFSRKTRYYFLLKQARKLNFQALIGLEVDLLQNFM